MSGDAVILSGMGVVSAAGIGLKASLDSMGAGLRFPGPLTLFDSPLALPVFEVRAVPPRRDPGRMRTMDLLLLALDEALESAGLSGAPLPRIGVALGTTVASQLNDLDFYAAWRSGREAPLDSVDGFLDGNLAESIARRLGSNGPA
ncbi:MAG: hypothetical protein U1E27_08640, partial [Kiritimatiellia bacterium]|nr:hypothetical protein [Kiritimatiellia bacterium]